MNDKNQILLFYGWWQLTVCAFAFAGLIAIWWHLGRKRKDYGQVWLALSLLCWSLSGLTEILLAYSNSDLLDGLRSIFSLFNSLFILLALPWFRYLPARIKPIIQSRQWILIIGLPFLFSLIPTLSKLISGESYSLISEADVYFSFLTLIFLGAVLWTSFKNRRLPLLAYLSLVCIAITIVAQLYKLTEAEINLILFSAIFKTCLIMIFFALALSWVKELTEEVQPDYSKIHLSLKPPKRNDGKTDYKILLAGINGTNTISLSRANYELLEKFVHQRKQRTNQWLEIRPKDLKGRIKIYDINDYNEIKRLLNGILDGIFGQGTWTKEKHYIPLKQALFEMSEIKPRHIRIRLEKYQLFV